jgi:NitT/TauT family transport system ATP-binding protein
VRIDLPRPRDPLSVEFLDCQKKLLGHLGQIQDRIKEEAQ